MALLLQSKHPCLSHVDSLAVQLIAEEHEMLNNAYADLTPALAVRCDLVHLLKPAYCFHVQQV